MDKYNTVKQYNVLGIENSGQKSIHIIVFAELQRYRIRINLRNLPKSHSITLVSCYFT